MIILFAVTEGFLDGVPLTDIPSFEDGLLHYVQQKEPDVYYDLDHTGEWQEGMQGTLQVLFAEYSAVRARKGSTL